MSTYPITISSRFHQVYPDAAVGILVLENVSNPKSCAPLDEQKSRVREFTARHLY